MSDVHLCTCRHCGQKYRVIAARLGKTIRCRNCHETTQLQPVDRTGETESTVGRAAEQNQTANISQRAKRLIFSSALWIVAGSMLCGLSPWIAPLGDVCEWGLTVVPLGITLTLVVATVRVSLLILRQTGRVRDTFTVSATTIVLFTLAFAQIGCHWGMEHYLVESRPSVFDWCGFTFVHALRVGDILDVIESYGLNIQRIHAVSWSTRLLLVVYQVFIGIFGVAVLAHALDRFRKTAIVSSGKEIGVFFLAAFVYVALFRQNWPWSQLVLWPIDRTLHALDVADVMNIYDIHLHQIPVGPWQAFLSVVFMAFVAELAAERLEIVFPSFSWRYLGGLGLGMHALRTLHDTSDDDAQRQRIRDRRDEVKSRREAVRDELKTELTRSGSLWLCALAVLLILPASLLFPSWEGRASALVGKIVGPHAWEWVEVDSQFSRYGRGDPLLESLVPQVPGVVDVDIASERHHIRIVCQTDRAEVEDVCHSVADEVAALADVDQPVQVLVRSGGRPDDAERMLRQLRRMGPTDRETSFLLAAYLPALDSTLQAAAVKSVLAMAPPGNNPLQEVFLGNDPELAETVFVAAAAYGPRAAPLLSSFLWQSGEQVVSEQLHQRAVETILGFGSAAGPFLLNGLSPANGTGQLMLLYHVDPLWYLRRPTSRFSSQAIAAHAQALRGLQRNIRRAPATGVDETTLEHLREYYRTSRYAELSELQEVLSSDYRWWRRTRGASAAIPPVGEPFRVWRLGRDVND